MASATTPMTQPLLSVQGLGVRFAGTGDPACDGISFDVHPGEILGIVGESGSGKSVTCRALMGMLPETAMISGTMTFDGQRVDLSDMRQSAKRRGAGLSMIFQDPMSALDPLMTVRGHLALRTKSDPVPILQRAGLADPAAILDSYAHQLSGGQCQRVAIGCALARTPKLLIADEPTTALDVTVQKGILDQLRRLATEQGTAVIFITHDIAVIYQLCARVMVMHRGHVVEKGPVEQVLTAPQHHYTKSLLAAIPRPDQRGLRLGHVAGEPAPSPAPPPPAAPPTISGKAPVLRFENINVRYKRRDGTSFDAVRNVSLTLHRGEILGLVGESGSGKSTVAKTAVDLAPLSAGEVWLKGEPLDWSRPKMAWRREVQYIFQDPRGALDPSARILGQVRQPLDIHRVGTRPERETRARALMAETQLEESLYTRKPSALSGGQRQRATIARALALHPEVLICDESISALDVSIQARVLNLLMDLRETYGIAILFISHDLGVIHHLCDRVAVMRHGQLVEKGETEPLFEAPQHDYTRTLLSAIPQLPAPTAAAARHGEPA